MATATKSNVFKKLTDARKKFMEASVKKSGKNFGVGFMYFELADIVPTATPIFSEVGLVFDTKFTADKAVMTFYDVDNPESSISFEAPFVQLSPIVSSKGKEVTNAMQSLGSSITYMRRYLYQMALDIVEADTVEPSITNDEEKTEAPKPVKPASTETRAEIKEEKTAKPSATENDIDTLKRLLAELISKDSSNEQFVQDVALKTEGFTKIDAEVCVQLIAYVEELLNEQN